MSMEPASGMTVRIGEVTDGREFADEADSLSVETMWDDEPLSTDESRVIGARAAQGETPTNIYLEGGDVEEIVSDLLSVAFRQAGYTVVGEGEADLVVSAEVERLWMWMTPGAMTIGVQSAIQVSVTVTGAGGTVDLQADGFHESRDVARSPDSYAFALDESLFDLSTKLGTAAVQMEPPVSTGE
jgi:hypothetical protein